MRGSLKKLAKDSWTATFDLPPGPNGERRQKRATFRGSKRDAEEALRRLIAAMEGGQVSFEAKRETLAAYLPRWLATKTKLATDTWDGYNCHIRYHLVPTLGGIQLSRLTPRDVTRALAAWRSSERHDRKSGQRSQRSVHHIFTTLRAALNAAVRDGLIATNPCLRVEAPAKGGSKVSALRLTQARAVVDGLRGTPLYATVVVKVATGLRRSELLALRWSDVDFAAKCISARRALTERRVRRDDDSLDHTISEKGMKTRNSRRIVPLPPFALEALREHARMQEAERRRIGATRGADGFVFGEADGSPMSPDRLSSKFYWTVRKLGLPTVSLQGLRHTFATVHGEIGTPLQVFSKGMGHSSIKTTADVYLTVLDEQQVAAATRLDAAFRGAAPRVRDNSVTRTRPRKYENRVVTRFFVPENLAPTGFEPVLPP